MSDPKKLLHMRSAIIGAQLAYRAMGGSTLPPDTAENIIVQQMEHNGLVPFRGDLGMCTQSAQSIQEIRRIYAIKMLEVLMLARRDSGLAAEVDEESIIRKAWRLTQVMIEEDQVAASLSTVSGQKVD